MIVIIIYYLTLVDMMLYPTLSYHRLFSDASKSRVCSPIPYLTLTHLQALCLVFFLLFCSQKVGSSIIAVLYWCVMKGPCRHPFQRPMAKIKNAGICMGATSLIPLALAKDRPEIRTTYCCCSPLKLAIHRIWCIAQLSSWSKTTRGCRLAVQL